MPHLKGKYKGKTGKIDVIEDYLGTEELSGTYDGRKQNWKNIKKEQLYKENLQREHLASIRKRREDQIRKTLTNYSKIDDINQKVGFILTWTLMPDAYRYISMIMVTEPKICQEMMKHLFKPMDLKNLDDYVAAIIAKGRGPKIRVSLDTIIKIERFVKKIKGKILIERDGKREEIKELYKR